MKKLSVIMFIVFALFALAACNRNDGAEAQDVAEQEISPTPTPYATLPPMPFVTLPPTQEVDPAPVVAATPAPSFAIPYDGYRFVYENAVRGVKLSMEVPIDFRTNWFSFGSPIPMDGYNFPGAKLFIGTIHPSRWHEFREPLTACCAEQFWYQPEEPYRIFVTCLEHTHLLPIILLS